MFLNKKGQVIISKETPKILFYIFFMVVVSFIIIFIFGIFSEHTIDTGSFDNHFPINLLLGSSNCLAYSSDDRIFSGIIDFNKFSEGRLSECFGSNRQGVELNFFSLDGSINQKIEINKELVSQGLFCDLEKSNLNCYSTRKYVLYHDGNMFKKGFIDFRVVTKVE